MTAATIVVLGAAGVLWIAWNSLRAAVIRGRVVGHERREGPDGLMDHPIIEYEVPPGGPARFTSSFSVGTTQKAAPWPVGSIVSVRIDGKAPRHHAPLSKAFFVAVGIVFLVVLVLAMG